MPADTWVPLTDVEQAAVSPTAPPHLWTPAGLSLGRAEDIQLAQTQMGQSPMSILVARGTRASALCPDALMDQQPHGFPRMPTEDTMVDLTGCYGASPARAL